MVKEKYKTEQHRTKKMSLVWIKICLTIHGIALQHRQKNRPFS
jgi:hypothetical protein